MGIVNVLAFILSSSKEREINFKKYSRLNNGIYNIFYGDQTRTCLCRRHAVGMIADSAFLHSCDFSVFCDKADVGHVFASSTSVYGTELFLFVPAAGQTH